MCCSASTPRWAVWEMMSLSASLVHLAAEPETTEFLGNADTESEGTVTKRDPLFCHKSFLKIQWCFYPLYLNTHISRAHTRSRDLLTRAQSRSTASSTSSWCPILATPSSSRSWCVILSSCSPLIFSRSKLLTYCCRLSSKPGHTRWKRRQI